MSVAADAQSNVSVAANCASRATTIFGWSDPVSPHVAAAREDRPVCDELLLHAIREELGSFAEAGGRLAIVETAGGVASPAPSGTLQCDALHPLGLPVLLVGDGRLGGISATICAAESLVARGFSVAAVALLCSDGGGLGNADTLRSHFALRGTPTIALPAPCAADGGGEPTADELRDWVDGSRELLDRLLDTLMEAPQAADYDRAGSIVHPGARQSRPYAQTGSSSDGDLASGDQSARLLEDDMRLLWHPYTSTTRPLPCVPVRAASGVHLHLHDGTRLIDGMSSWWAAVHGYAVPEIDRAAVAQLGRMSHVMFGGITHEGAVGLGRRLVDITPPPLQRVFLCDSGSVAIEVAIKMALQYWRARGIEGRDRLLTVRGGYHGDTFGAMAVCDPDNGMHAQMFSGVLPRHVFASRPAPAFGAPCTDADIAELEGLLDAHTGEIAAVILEPIVQGAGGMRFYSAEYLKRVRSLCDARGALLILDCIATGFGRTGKLFACEHAGISPDIMCVGKALTGGYMTMGATLATQAVADGASGGVESPQPIPLMHGPTFMANPLACAVACASIDLLLSTPWQERVEAIESQLRSQLAPCAESSAVADVRVLGAIGVVEMKESIDVASTQSLLARHGVWLRPFGKLLYTMPPFVVSEDELGQITSGMRAVVGAAA